MSSGFNTDVKIGDRVFHVQTEDRGPGNTVIDTTVYREGHILHRRTSSYQREAGLSLSSSEGLSRQVAEQHRAVMEAIRSGTLDAEFAAAEEAMKANRAGGIQVQLLNQGSWLTAGKVSLEIEVSRRADKQPQAGALVKAKIEGALDGSNHSGTSDEQGRARVQFSLPPLGKGDLALVISAQADSGHDEIRFAMRTRAKTPDSSPAQC
jgi:hypothetical protein